MPLAPTHRDMMVWPSEFDKYAHFCRLFDISRDLRSLMCRVEEKWLWTGSYDLHMFRLFDYSGVSHGQFGILGSQAYGARRVILSLFPEGHMLAPNRPSLPHDLWSSSEYDAEWFRVINTNLLNVVGVQLRDVVDPVTNNVTYMRWLVLWFGLVRPWCKVEVRGPNDVLWLSVDE